MSIKCNCELRVGWERAGRDQASTCLTQVPGSGARAKLTQPRRGDLHCKIYWVARTVLLSLPDGRRVSVEYRSLPDNQSPDKETSSGRAEIGMVRTELQ